MKIFGGRWGKTLEGESPLFRRGGSLPPNLPLSPRTSPMSPPFPKRRFVSFLESGGDMGKVFVFWEVRICCRVRLSRSFCGWDAVRDYTLYKCRTPPAHKSGAKPHSAKPSHLPSKPKTSPKSTRKKQSEPNLRTAWAGALGGSSRRVREVWRVAPPLRKRGGCASKVFRSFLTSPRESFNQRAELGAVGVAVKIETA